MWRQDVLEIQDTVPVFLVNPEVGADLRPVNHPLFDLANRYRQGTDVEQVNQVTDLLFSEVTRYLAMCGDLTIDIWC